MKWWSLKFGNSIHRRKENMLSIWSTTWSPCIFLLNLQSKHTKDHVCCDHIAYLVLTMNSFETNWISLSNPLKQRYRWHAISTVQQYFCAYTTNFQYRPKFSVNLITMRTHSFVPLGYKRVMQHFTFKGCKTLVGYLMFHQDNQQAICCFALVLLLLFLYV